MSTLNNLIDNINTPIFISIFAAISSDPTPAEAWLALYNNLFIRFIFIFIVIYQTNPNINKSLIITTATIYFFYMISTPEEKKKIITNNFNKKDLKIFAYFCIYLFILYKII